MAFLRSTLLLLSVLCAGCGADRVCLGRACPQQSQTCRDFIDCYERTGGVKGSFDSTFGPTGSCWKSNESALAQCNDSCAISLLSFRTSFPDAGCK